MTQWEQLTDAYGAATDVPVLLQALASTDNHESAYAHEELTARLAHQGSRSEASSHAALQLIEYLNSPNIPNKPRIIQLLADIAIGNVGDWLETDLQQLRREVAREESLSAQDLQLEVDAWISSGVTEEIREARRKNANFLDPVFVRNSKRWALEAYDAVKSGISTYRRSLWSSDPETCMWAAHLLGWFPELKSVLTVDLLKRAALDTNERISATICIALGLLGEDSLCNRFLHSSIFTKDAEIRWGGAIGLALIKDDPGRVALDALVECRLSGNKLHHDQPFPLGAFAHMLIEQDKAGAWRLRPGRVTSPGLRYASRGVEQ